MGQRRQRTCSTRGRRRPAPGQRHVITDDGRSPANEWSLAGVAAEHGPRSSRRRVRSSGDHHRVGHKTIAGPRSWDKATTWYWTRRRSTGPPSLALTRRWRPMRSLCSKYPDATTGTAVRAFSQRLVQAKKAWTGPFRCPNRSKQKLAAAVAIDLVKGIDGERCRSGQVVAIWAVSAIAAAGPGGWRGLRPRSPQAPVVALKADLAAVS